MTTKIEIRLQDGTTLTAELENYNAELLAQEVNDKSSSAIAIGENVIQKFAISYIRPANAEDGTIN